MKAQRHSLSARPTDAGGKYLQNACNYLFALRALAGPTSPVQ